MDEAIAAQDLTGTKDREQVSEGLKAVLNALPPAPSSPLDTGIRQRRRANTAAQTSSEPRRNTGHAQGCQ